MYVISKSLDVHNAYSRIGRTYRNQTFSFTSDELLTSRAVHDIYGILRYPFECSWMAFNYAEIANLYIAGFFFKLPFHFLNVFFFFLKEYHRSGSPLCIHRDFSIAYLLPSGVVQKLLIIQLRRITIPIPKV